MVNGPKGQERGRCGGGGRVGNLVDFGLAGEEKEDVTLRVVAVDVHSGLNCTV